MKKLYARPPLSLGSKKNKSSRSHFGRIALLLIIQQIILWYPAAMAQTYSWANAGGSTTTDKAQATAIDGFGNMFIAGKFTGPATFSATTINGYDLDDAFVAKYNHTGNLVWAIEAGGDDNDAAQSISADGNGNSYITGIFRGTATFGSHTLNSSNETDSEIFIVKIDPSGTVLWAKRAGGVEDDEGTAIAVAGDRLIVAGNFKGVADFDTEMLTSAGMSNAFIASYNLADGSLIWARTGGAANDTRAAGVSVDNNGNIYVAGKFRGVATFGTHTLTNPSTVFTDSFVLKMNPGGNFTWARRSGTPNANDEASAVATDLMGNVYVAGMFRNTAQFGNYSLASAGHEDIYVARYNTFGTVQYAKRWGGMNQDFVRGIGTNGSTVYISGEFVGIVYYLGNQSMTSAGGRDGYLARITGPTGVMTWIERTGGIGNDEAPGVAVRDEAVAFAGSFEHGPAHYGPFELTTFGAHDASAVRMTFPFSSFCNSPGDFTMDGPTNTEDLLLFMSYYGCTEGCYPYDMTDDDRVNVQDMLMFTGAYGSGCQ